jgi:hypothetical protein
MTIEQNRPSQKRKRKRKRRRKIEAHAFNTSIKAS